MSTPKKAFCVKFDAQKGIASRFRMHATFKIMLPTEGGEQIFKKTNKNKEKRVQRAIKRQRKQQMAHEIHKIADVMHTVIFAEWPWRRKVHETAARSYFLNSAWSETLARRTSNGATRPNSSGKHGSYEGRLAVRKVILLMRSARGQFAKPCFPL